MIRHSLRLALLVGVVALASRVSQAEVILDQIHHFLPDPFQVRLQTLNPPSELDPLFRGQVAQTFTVGRTGVLASVDLAIFRTPTFQNQLTVDIGRVVGGVPDFNADAVLAHQVVDGQTLPMFEDVDIYKPTFTLSTDFLNAGLRVKPGDVLAIIFREGFLTAPASRPLNELYDAWWTNNEQQPSYPRGDAFFHPASRDRDFDLQFRTFVLIPEPTAAYLLAMALPAIARCGSKKGRSIRINLL